jgi:hypothetical protein
MLGVNERVMQWSRSRSHILFADSLAGGEVAMRQILYISNSTAPEGADLVGILEQSRHNNAINGVTGLLWSDGVRFVQVFEGPDESVALTWERIQKDPRHHEIHVLVDRPIAAREFGYWSMAHRGSDEGSHVHDARVRRLVAYASPVISEPFLTMLGSENAADP